MLGEWTLKDRAHSLTDWEIQLHHCHNLDTGTLHDEQGCYDILIYSIEILTFPCFNGSTPLRPRSSSRSRTNEDERGRGRGRTRTNEDELEDELGKKRFRAINIDAGATPSDEIDGTCYEQVMSSVWQTQMVQNSTKPTEITF